jgi:hypothetical protein
MATDALIRDPIPNPAQFQEQQAYTIGILRKYAKADFTTLNTAWSYMTGAILNLWYPRSKARKPSLPKWRAHARSWLKPTPRRWLFENNQINRHSI